VVTTASRRNVSRGSSSSSRRRRRGYSAAVGCQEELPQLHKLMIIQVLF